MIGDETAAVLLGVAGEGMRRVSEAQKCVLELAEKQMSLAASAVPAASLVASQAGSLAVQACRNVIETEKKLLDAAFGR